MPSYTWTRPHLGAGNPSVMPFSTGPGDVAPASVTPASATDPRRDQAGELLVQLFAYLVSNAEEHAALVAAVPVMSSAVADFRTGQAADPFDGVRAVVQKLNELRASDPSIPDT